MSVLYDGSMPMYVGMGNIRSRLRKARRGKSRGQMWDHFSWFKLSDTTFMRDVEALLLRTLPPVFEASIATMADSKARKSRATQRPTP